MTRNGKRISVFTLAVIFLCISFARFYLFDCCHSSIAKNNKAKKIITNKAKGNQSNRIKNDKDKDKKAKNSKEAGGKSQDKKPTNNEVKDKKSKGGQTKSKIDTNSESSPISEGHEIDWRKKSTEAGMLVFQKKYAEAEPIFVTILPLARNEDTHGIDLAVCLLRYGSCLVGEKKYQQGLANLEEALKIAQMTPATKRQKKAIFQTLKTISTAYIRLNQFDKGEKYARKAIAYRIAFPETSSIDYFKNTYEGLRFCLENQKKTDEANAVAEIIKTLS